MRERRAMKRHYLKDIALTVVYVLYVALDLGSSPSAPSPLSDPRIRQRVADLASDDFAARAAASTALVAIGEPALPALQEALKTDNLEIRARASTIIKTIRDTQYPPRRILEIISTTTIQFGSQELPIDQVARAFEKASGLSFEIGPNIDVSQVIPTPPRDQTLRQSMDEITNRSPVRFHIVPGAVRIMPCSALSRISKEHSDKLDSARFDIRLEDTDVFAAFDVMSRATDVPILLDPLDPICKQMASKKISLSKNGILVFDAVPMMLGNQVYDYSFQHGVVIVSTPPSPK